MENAKKAEEKGRSELIGCSMQGGLCREGMEKTSLLGGRNASTMSGGLHREEGGTKKIKKVVGGRRFDQA